jgi:hypothetical protein
MTVFDIVRGHPSAIKSDDKFGYDVNGEKVFGLDDKRNILDLKTGKKTGQWLMPSSLANTPGFEIKTNEH